MTIVGAADTVAGMCEALERAGVILRGAGYSIGDRDSSPRLIDSGRVGEQDADMTTIEATRSAALPRETASRADERPPFPFEALDRLAAVRLALDEDVANLIGRLQPYVTQAPTAELRERAGDDVMPSELSALETRIETEIASFQEIHARLLELARDVRL